MGSENTTATTTEPGRRRLGSWIESFVDETANLHSPTIFRRWAAISTIAAVLEQKVWVQTSSPLYPNLYVYLIAHPGVGKSRTIDMVHKYCSDISGLHLAPTSMTFASMVDFLTKAKRELRLINGSDLKYNSMYICAGELGTFMHKYDNEMIDGLSDFYDTRPYGQVRRTNEVKIKIRSPLVNMLCGSTPQNLSNFLPEKAWGQGFTSRLLLIFSDERIIADDFDIAPTTASVDLAHDLEIINCLVGGFTITDPYRQAVNNWRALGESPIPSHPKLIHYITRRRAHLYKLSMVASVDRCNDLILTVDDFNTAMNWLVQAERWMPDVFKAGATNADAQASEEILHFIKINDGPYGVSEQLILRFARDRLPIQTVPRIIELLESSGEIRFLGVDKTTRVRFYTTRGAPANLAQQE